MGVVTAVENTLKLGRNAVYDTVGYYRWRSEMTLGMVGSAPICDYRAVHIPLHPPVAVEYGKLARAF